MTSIDLKTASPLGIYQAYCRDGKLAYQATANGTAVFHPRVAAPGSGEPLTWQVSQGLGTVYSTTVVHAQGTAPYNVALIDLDEGFRMMSCVEDVDPAAVAIGMRVMVRMRADEDGVMRPAFTPLAEGA